MSVAARTHIGLVRKTNEDQYFVDSDKGLYIVADGIGGHQNGQIASDLAVQSFVDYMDCFIGLAPATRMREAFQHANDTVHRYQERVVDGKLMGTTLTAMLIERDMLYFGHIGDSRIYFSRHKKDISQITKDHTYLAELALHDPVSYRAMKEDAFMDKKNYLVRAIGPEAAVDPQFAQLPLEHGDMMLMMTDGLYKYIPPAEMLEVIHYTDNLPDLLLRLEQLALERGGRDNLTGVVYQYEGR